MSFSDNFKEFHEMDSRNHIFSELGEYMPKAECCDGNTFLYMCSHFKAPIKCHQLNHYLLYYQK